MLFAIGELRGETIRRPSGQTPPKIRRSPRWYPYFRVSIDNIHYSWLDMLVLSKLSTNRGLRCHFQDCIGAINGTHVTARVPRSQFTAYRGRKHYTSQNVLVSVDFDMEFTYVLVGWEGSTHDTNILADNMA